MCVISVHCHQANVLKMLSQQKLPWDNKIHPLIKMQIDLNYDAIQSEFDSTHQSAIRAHCALSAVSNWNSNKPWQNELYQLFRLTLTA